MNRAERLDLLDFGNAFYKSSSRKETIFRKSMISLKFLNWKYNHSLITFIDHTHSIKMGVVNSGLCPFQMLPTPMGWYLKYEKCVNIETFIAIFP